MAYIGEIARRDIGSETGKSLHDALSQLADIKMRQMLQRQDVSRQGQAYNELLSNYGYDQEEGQQLGQTLAKLPQKTQETALRDLIIRKHMQQQQEKQSDYQDFMQQRQQGTQPATDSQNIPQQYARAQFTNPQQSMPMQQGYTPFQTPQMAFQQQKLQRQYANQELKQQRTDQKDINRNYKKFNDEIYEKAMKAETIKAQALRALELIDSGKTREGLSALVPQRLWGAEDRELQKNLVEIGLQRADVGGGQMSKMKILTAQAAKPSIDMPKKAQRKMILEIIQDADKVLDVAKMRDNVIEANGGVAPDGLDRIVTQMYHNKYSGNTGQLQQQNQSMNMQQPTSGQQSQGYDDSNEDIVDQGARLAVGTASRIAPKVLTGPGDILGLGASAADYVANKFGKDLGAKETLEKYSPLPTSESVEKRISKWTNGYTDPKGPAEQFGYNVADIFGSFLMPQAAAGKVAQIIEKAGITGKKATTVKNIILPFSGYVGSKKRLLTQAASGEAAKEVISTLGGGPALQTAAQVGGFLLAGSAGTRTKLTKDTTALFNEVKAESKDIPVDVRSAIPKLEAIKEEAFKNASKHKDEVAEITNRYIDAMEKNPEGFPLSNIVGQIQSTNDLFKLSKEQRVSLEATTPEAIRPYLHDIRKVLNESIDNAKDISSKANDLVTKYQVANDNWRGLNTHGKATQFLIDHADQFGHGGTKYHFVFNLLKGGVALLGRDIAKVQSLLRTPVGQKAYLEAIEAASAGNMSRFKMAYNKLISIAKKENIS